MSKRIAIMQPYIFPYIGYFQLLNHVDKFIFYDDVNYIKQGWINRNQVTINGNKLLYTIPLTNGSSNKLIYEVKINQGLFVKARKKLYKSIEQSYRKAPYFSEVYGLIQETFNLQTESINEMAQFSVKSIANYLEIDTVFAVSKGSYNNESLQAQNRVIDICLQEKATHYINPIGGKSLYSSKEFQEKDLKLSFLENNINNHSVLILDLLMNLSKEEIKNSLNQFTLK